MWNASASWDSGLRPRFPPAIRAASVDELLGQGGLRSCRAGRSFQLTGPGRASLGGFDGPRDSAIPSAIPTITSATTTAAIGQKNRMPPGARLAAAGGGFRELPVRRLGA